MTFKAFFSKLTSRYLWGHLIAMGIIVVGLGVGLFFFLDAYTYHGHTISMPNVCGERSEVAQRKLEALGLRIEVSDTGYNARLAANVILAQSIPAGTPVKPNRLLFITINASSARTIPLPDLADNCSLREAEMRLTAIGFRLGPIKRVSGERDWVYGVEIGGRSLRPGERISVERPVTLLVGDGKSEEVFNGNDSLDYMYFSPKDTSDILLEDLSSLP
ncbi:MAG: PASTA domain-containing protein [Bacteroidales bacterium]|nr:PASTA domain-containing protein [Bacteroidales bacterium]